MAEYVGIGAYVLYLFDEAATHYVDNYDGTSHIGFKSNGSSFAGLSGASSWAKLNDHSVSGSMKYACSECVDVADNETTSLVFMVWSNHDIYDEDGNLYYNGTNYNGTYNGVDLPEIPADLLAQYPFAVIVEGTELKEEEPDEPEPFDHYSFQVGIALGLASVGQFKETQKEPVAYLYNGVRLPKLPEWDREKYPYAVITRNDMYPYSVVVSSHPCYFNDTEGESKVLYIDVEEYTGQIYIRTADAPNEFVWKQDDPFYGFSSDYAIWSNFDLYTKSGTLYLSASEPTPVYTVEPETYALYNGTQAPTLPEWDEEKYPYAAICVYNNNDKIKTLVRSTTKFVVNNSLFRYLRLKDDGDYEIDRIGAIEDRWEHYIEDTGSGTAGSNVVYLLSNTLIWANHDVCYADDVEEVGGTVYLSASEPVPVYE